VCDPYTSLATLGPEVETLTEPEGDEVPLETVVGGKARTLAVGWRGGALAFGRWVRGRREGRGSLISPALERRGVTVLRAEYRAGLAEGQGRLVMADSTIVQGWFLGGVFHGPARFGVVRHCTVGS
jgi:hypothetical protein